MPFILVGNKVDLEDRRCVGNKEAQDVADMWKVKYYETSAKTRVNVDNVFNDILRDLIKKKELESPKAAETSKNSLNTKMMKKKLKKCSLL